MVELLRERLLELDKAFVVFLTDQTLTEHLHRIVAELSGAADNASLLLLAHEVDLRKSATSQHTYQVNLR